MNQADTALVTEQLDTGSLTHRTSRGFAWMISQAMATKVVTAVGQIIVAWYLLPEDFGVISIAFMFSIFPLLIQQGGLKEVLIARHAHFRRWANSAFWMSMVLGLAGGVVMAAVAPVAAHLYQQPVLTGLLLVIAVLFPLESISIVPLAHMQGQMRFRLVAAMEMGKALLLTALTIVLAWWGFGPYSLIVPRVVVSVIVAVVCWSVAPVSLRGRPQMRRWRFLISDGTLVIAANACDYMMQYVGPFLLSLSEDTAIVGLFWFASYHSTQATALITYQLGSVLLPALSKLHFEPERQTDAFLRAVRMLACIAMPACLLQAALIDPVVHLLFPAKWWDAIVLLQVLSIGMAMRAAGWPAIAMLQAQRRFATRMGLAVVSLATLAALVVAGMRLDEQNPARGAAIGAALQMFIIEPFVLYLAVHPMGHGWRRVGSALLIPAAIAIGTVAPAALAAWGIGALKGRHLWQCVVIVLIAMALYLPLLWFFAPAVWVEARDRLAVLLRRHRAPSGHFASNP